MSRSLLMPCKLIMQEKQVNRVMVLTGSDFHNNLREAFDAISARNLVTRLLVETRVRDSSSIGE